MTADPLRRFEHEHEEALVVLTRLEQAALALREPGNPAPHLESVRAALVFLEGPVKAHNENEERALFPELGTEAPTAPFVDEHRVLWELEQALGEALRFADAEVVADTALQLVDLLRGHIDRENTVLFPMARGLLGAGGLARVAERLGD